jgi:hypothetical protein
VLSSSSSSIPAPSFKASDSLRPTLFRFFLPLLNGGMEDLRNGCRRE